MDVTSQTAITLTRMVPRVLLISAYGNERVGRVKANILQNGRSLGSDHGGE